MNNTQLYGAIAMLVGITGIMLTIIVTQYIEYKQRSKQVHGTKK